MALLASRVALGVLVSLVFHAEAESLTFNAEAAKNRPVSKVTTLLKDMLKQLEAEAAADQETYEKLACWCTTGDSEKTAAIAAAEASIESLQKNIEKLTATIARLTAEIEKTEKEVAANEDALAKATALREKELAAFKEEEAFLLESIATLSSAIDVLSKHHGGSFLQVPGGQNVALQLRSALQQVLDRGPRGLRGPALTSAQQRILLAAMQEQASSGQPVAVDSYNAASGEIFGVLTQMKETFEKDLASAQEEEQSSQKAFEDLKAGKEAEIAAGKAQIEAKTSLKADAVEALANAKVDLEDTQNSLAADQEFLMMLKEKCSLTDKEFEERTTVRQEEMGAVSKALAVLSGDSAQDLFSRTLSGASAAALLQSGARAKSKHRNDASQLLSSVARRYRSPRLAQLAVRVRLDAFTKVKKSIDDMIAELLKEKEDEIKHKDFCTDELNTNQLQTEKKTREKEDLLSKIEELTMAIKKLTEEIDTLKAEVGDLQLQLKRVGEDREQESREFQQTVADQRATQKLLQAALTILQDFYGKSFLQTGRRRQEPVGAPPPPGFSAYKNNAMSGGVMAEITQIMEDAAAMEKEAIKCEVEAQGTYEAFVKETVASIDVKAKEIVNLTEEKAKTEGELSETEQAKEFAISELESLASYNAELHTSCDYILKNFDVRQTARDEEVAALKQAKAILSGANFEFF